MPADHTYLALLARPIAISVAGRDAELRPSVAHAYGCRVVGAAGPGQPMKIRVFVLRDEARRVLADIAANGEVATVYSDVRSFRSLQIKGHDAVIDAFDAEDAVARTAHHRLTADELVALGYAAPLAHGYFSTPKHGDFVTVSFSPQDVFQQTPGPGAGDKLGVATDAKATGRKKADRP
ncbi:hypothetical protein [Dongia sp.]|jgi:hypothetical protein|uniref:hypothetical protein n=1 Tax=Dongia sp. TaxID=1977262 RepID=UPI0035B4EFC5